MPAGTWFDIVAVAAHGALHNARVHAASSDEARRQAELDGMRVIACQPVAAARWQGFALRNTRARLDVALFAHELAALLDAGLGIVEALQTLGARGRGAEQRAIFGRIVRALSEGHPLSAALAQQDDVFPQLLVAAVGASEQTGELAAALRRFAEHQLNLRALRGRFIGAAIYPLVLLAVGGCVVLFLLGFVVPRFALLIESTPHDIPLASRLLLSWGSALAAHRWAFALVLAAIVLALALLVLRARRSGWRLAGMQRLWLIGPLIRLFRQAQFYRTASMLVGGGFPALRALAMASALLTPEDQRSISAALTAISEGQSIGAAMAASGVADVVAQRMLEVASRTGKLAATLERIASFQEAGLARSMDVTARLVEPALMVFIGLVIGGIVVLMYMPIFELAAGLQ